MITKPTVDRIMEATDIVEVIGEFVQLKKRGANYVGLSPFANERTPSFTVSPAKGIFKDFSSGKGGSAVTFLMELEKFTYPEALKWLAKKYGIPVEETVDTTENLEEQNHRESLMIVSGYAAKFFHESLLDTDEGQNIGLSYFKERGFSNDTIKKFELGYSPDQWEAFTGEAIKQGYQEEYLVESGLSVKRDNGSLYDRYRGRVMFPIHSFTGRVIAFGGRTLKSDKNVPKYVNSPESEIYHKSNILYGLYFAKRSIREEDNCYLVEGYADVISVHQAGIENVVASSGTSLTVEQIRLIGRLTKNITILYDGDAAGIKASLRGLDMILEEGLNVKVVLLPDGHDPDSYVQKFGTNAFKTHIDQNKKDFIVFKTDILLKEVGDDPIRKADAIRDIVESIAKIPDFIKVELFVKQCSSLLAIQERSLLTEVNKIKLGKQKKYYDQQKVELSKLDVEKIEIKENPPVSKSNVEDKSQEEEVIRLLVTYGHNLINWDGIADTYIGSFIIANIADVIFANKTRLDFIEIYKNEIEAGKTPDETFFISHIRLDISTLAIQLLLSPYVLSPNWLELHRINVNDETKNMKSTILGGIYHLKKAKIERMKTLLSKQIKESTIPDEVDILLSQFNHLKKVERTVADYLGIVILK
ncbi:DNA primase [Mucilaginibacter terrigena]|uniref:DNA primase n=1 Tax=Mucilaginibacter terrigena TaxID=2492395 RepID=A0A4Q5LIR4_9SPHI|nr:DNA primase [Mucilaginibacter terrigena]RYU89301.1 DNA primase [Mucilaginibacter terrigena]